MPRIFRRRLGVEAMKTESRGRTIRPGLFSSRGVDGEQEVLPLEFLQFLRREVREPGSVGP